MSRVVVTLLILSGPLAGCGNPFLTPSCDDGIDNDGDGLADAADPDCAGGSDTDGEPTRPQVDAGWDAGDAGMDAGTDAGMDAGMDAGTDGALPDGGCAYDAGVDPLCEPMPAPILCGGSCVDVRASLEHCGGCDAPCGTREMCAAGTCVACNLVAAGSELCDGRCTLTDSDPSHCGGCDRPCRDDEVCSGGSCVIPTFQGQLCTEPLVVMGGETSVRLYPEAALGPAAPGCLPAGTLLPVGRVLALPSASAGTLTLTVTPRAANQVLAQVYLDELWECAPRSRCVLGEGTGEAVTLMIPVDGITSARVLVLGTRAEQVTVDVAGP